MTGIDTMAQAMDLDAGAPARAEDMCISKKGDRYIRTLLTHGARSVLRSATVARRAGREIDRLKHWALAVQGRTNHNKAACALANKLARIAWAVWVKQETYRGQALPAVQSPLCSA
jgi:hypothetical protein